MKTEPIEALKEIKHCTWIAGDFNISDGFESHEVVDEDDAINIANVAFREGQFSPKVKQLEWDVKELSSAIVECRCKTPIGDYRITNLSSVGLFDLWGSGHSDYSPFVRFGEFDTYEEAKAAAQADFEKRVMECLGL